MNDTPRSAPAPLGAVGRFFFLPTDPTTLGFMRVMTGLLLLYTHAAYSLDLKNFFGPHAWWDQQAGNAQRREAPYIPTPLGWSDYEPTLRLEETPHRRAAMIEYLRSMPEDPKDRLPRIRYLEKLFRLTAGDTEARQRAYNEGINLANSVAKLVDQAQEAKVREALARPEVPDERLPVHVPGFVRELPSAERLELWADVQAFNAGLPPDAEKHEFLLNWLANYPADQRDKLYKFLAGTLVVDGKDLSLPADRQQRDEFLEFLERWGGDTRQAAEKGTKVFSHWFHLTDPASMWFAHIIALGVFLLFTVGLWTRVTSVLAWAVSLAYIHRGQVTLFGQDTMQTLLVTYLMIGPSGAALSLDALRKRYRAAKALMGTGARRAPWAESALAGPRPDWLANLAIRMAQINFCFIYLSSGVSKLKGTSWWEHSAAWLVMANPEFGLVRYQAYEWVLRVLVENKVALNLVAGGVSLFTLVLEIGFVFMVWTRLRPVVVCASILLHLGIAIMMGLSVFSLYMFALVLCYFPARLIRERVTWSSGAGRRLTVRYDGRDARAVRKVSLIRALDVAGQVTFVDAGSGKAAGGPDGTVHLTDPDGHQVDGHDLYATALRELALLRPVKWLGHVPGVWALVSAWAGR